MTNHRLEKELKKLRIKYKKDKNLKYQLKVLFSELTGQYCEVTDHQIKLNLPKISLTVLEEIHYILKDIALRINTLKFSIEIEDFQFTSSNHKYLIINW